MRLSHKRNAIAYRERYFVLAISDVNEKVGAGTVIGFEETRQHVDKGGFAGPIRSDKRDPGAGCQVEIDRLGHDQRAEPLCQAANRQGGGRGHCRCLARQRSRSRSTAPPPTLAASATPQLRLVPAADCARYDSLRPAS